MAQPANDLPPYAAIKAQSPDVIRRSEDKPARPLPEHGIEVSQSNYLNRITTTTTIDLDRKTIHVYTTDFSKPPPPPPKPRASVKAFIDKTVIQDVTKTLTQDELTKIIFAANDAWNPPVGYVALGSELLDYGSTVTLYDGDIIKKSPDKLGRPEPALVTMIGEIREAALSRK